ncbi:MAG: hypothetical protein LDL30_01925 [Desulfovibrio sp.]|nr:hypothetical protein [Desulfovibrio sp.]
MRMPHAPCATRSMMYAVAFALTLALPLALTGMGPRAASAQPAPPADPALTPAEVEDFFRSFQEIRPLFEYGITESGSDDNADDPDGPLQELMAQAVMQPKAIEIIQSHGLTLERWGQVAQRVFRAYTTLKLGAEGKNPRAQLQAAMAELERDTTLSPGEKAMIRKEMEDVMEQMGQLLEEAPKADQDAVRPFMAQLDAVFDADE